MESSTLRRCRTHGSGSEGFNERIISLYASGMTVRDIRAHLAELYDVEVSPDLISRVTDAVHTEVKDWQSRPLDRVYPVIWLDALVCKVRDEGVVRNKAAHLALGVTAEGRKEVLGLWVEANEGAKFWLRVMNELRARGVDDVLVLVCDGLNGLPEGSACPRVCSSPPFPGRPAHDVLHSRSRSVKAGRRPPTGLGLDRATQGVSLSWLRGAA